MFRMDGWKVRYPAMAKIIAEREERVRKAEQEQDLVAFLRRIHFSLMYEAVNADYLFSLSHKVRDIAAEIEKKIEELSKDEA